MRRGITKLFVITLFFMLCAIVYYHNSFMGLAQRHLTGSLDKTVPQTININIKNHVNKSKALETTHKTTRLTTTTHKTTRLTTTTHKTTRLTTHLQTTTQKPKPTNRPVTCKGCFPNSFEILSENKDICKTKTGEKIDLVIIIFTYIKSMKRREVIRNTWTQHSKKNTANSRYFFAFGRYPKSKENEDIAKEASKYGDIVQAGFGESYYNLTYKTITMLGWVAKNCPKAKNVMKTDDDMWVNIPKLIEKFNKNVLSKTIAGCCMRNAGPIRNIKSKWYASRENYPGDSYPDFCSGTGYIMDMNTAIAVHKISVDVPFLYLEDVYVALCIQRLGKDYHVQPTDGFYNGKYSMTNLCTFKSYVLTSHYMESKDIQKIWDAKC